MRSNFFFDSTAIPLWRPAPVVNSHEKFKESYICVGDVGFFKDGGEFEVLFNIFLSEADNHKIGLVPPYGFQECGSLRFSDEVSAIAFESGGYKSRSGDFHLEAPSEK
jgi:hypothetical protein